MSQGNLFFRGWMLFLGGLCMGAADLVPGISGGTIAFILGFYHPLLQSLKTLNKTALIYMYQRQWKLLFQHIEWQFLTTLGSGVLCAMVILVHPFQSILENPQMRVYLYATFMGLVLSSFYFCLRQLRQWNLRIGAAFFVGVIVAFQLTSTTVTPVKTEGWKIDLLLSSAVPLRNYDDQAHQLTGLSPLLISGLLKQGMIQDQTLVYAMDSKVIGSAAELAASQRFSWIDLKMIGCGALAICALLLPGISGSYILTLLGVYPVVIGAFADFIRHLSHFHFQAESFIILANLGCGIVIGALAFAKSLSYLMKNYPDLSLSVLSGFMIGALRSVWPFWTYAYTLLPLKIAKGPQLIPVEPIFPIHDPVLLSAAGGCICLGFMLVWLIEKLAHQRQIGLNVSG
jgi:putative membrane protein